MRAVELFVGAGGAALGLRQAGVRCLEAVEWDEHAAATAQAAGFPVVQADVRAWLESDRPEQLRGQADLLWSSFPCQAWSQAGKRKGARDDRNLWPQTVQAIDRVKPMFFLGENVKGLTHHRKKSGCEKGRHPQPMDCPACYLAHQIMTDLADRFEHVEYRILDAADYGVPQRRHRLILYGGPVPFPWPEPTHSEAALVEAKWVTGTYWSEHGINHTADGSGIGVDAVRSEKRILGRLRAGKPVDGLGRKRWTTIRDAIGPMLIQHWSRTAQARKYGPSCAIQGSRPPALFSLSTQPNVASSKHPDTPADRPAGTLRSGGAGHSEPYMYAVFGGGTNPHSKGAGHERRLGEITDRPSTTIVAQTGGGSGSAGPFVTPSPATLEAGSQPERLDRPSPAVTTTEVKGSREGGMGKRLADGTVTGGPDRGSDALWLATGRRRLTVEECAALQDFPPGWPWQGKKTSRYRQVGNAVPSGLAEAIGRAVVEAFQQMKW